MLLSIIIPSFNQGALLYGALESVEKQTFANYEILIMDACSSDNTEAVVSGFAHLPIRLYTSYDYGIYDAMNKGIALSKGSYLYFMGCDDRLYNSEILEKVFVFNNLQYDFIYGNVIFVKGNYLYDGKFNKMKLIQRNICHQAIFIKKTVFNNLGLFNLRYKYLADWQFNMKCFNDNKIKKIYLNLIIARYNNSGSSFAMPDDNFTKDREILNIKYFPKIIRIINNRIIPILTKIQIKYNSHKIL